MKYNSLINAIKFITSCNTFLSTIYSASELYKVISICNLQRHNTVHPLYPITYHVCDMIFYALYLSA